MNSNEKQVEFYKKEVLSKIEKIKEHIPSIRYKLYKTMIEKSDNVDELRELSDLDMQVKFIDYMEDLKKNLDESDTTLKELQEVCKGVYVAKEEHREKTEEQIQEEQRVREENNIIIGEALGIDEEAVDAIRMMLRLRELEQEQLGEDLENVMIETAM